MQTCTRCPYNGKGDSRCITCDGTETYSYKYNQYILDGYDAPQPDTKGSELVTPASEDLEDKLRKAIYDLFDLSPMELLVLLSIIHRKTLLETADDLTKLIRKQDKVLTRNHIFMLRKSIGEKLPYLKTGGALMTDGQRKAIR